MFRLCFVFSSRYNTMITVANLMFEILSNSLNHRSLVSYKGSKIHLHLTFLCPLVLIYY